MNDATAQKLSSVGRRHAILAARARRLAKPREQGETVASISCLLCESGGQLYALPLQKIARVTASSRPAPVPTRNPAMLGIVGRAGVFYHVYDLAALVGGGAAGGLGYTVMLRGNPPVAFQVDSAVRVVDAVMLEAAEAANLRPGHPIVTGFARTRDASDAGRTISFIDPDRLSAAALAENGETPS